MCSDRCLPCATSARRLTLRMTISVGTVEDVAHVQLLEHVPHPPDDPRRRASRWYRPHHARKSALPDARADVSSAGAPRAPSRTRAPRCGPRDSAKCPTDSRVPGVAGRRGARARGRVRERGGEHPAGASTAAREIRPTPMYVRPHLERRELGQRSPVAGSRPPLIQADHAREGAEPLEAAPVVRLLPHCLDRVPELGDEDEVEPALAEDLVCDARRRSSRTASPGSSSDGVCGGPGPQGAAPAGEHRRGPMAGPSRLSRDRSRGGREAVVPRPGCGSRRREASSTS